jgi:hypothetical protein
MGGYQNLVFGGMVSLLLAVGCIFVIYRYGILGFVVALTAQLICQWIFITPDFSRFYIGNSLFAVALLLGGALYAAKIALGDQKLFADDMLDA